VRAEIHFLTARRSPMPLPGPACYRRSEQAGFREVARRLPSTDCEKGRERLSSALGLYTHKPNTTTARSTFLKLSDSAGLHHSPAVCVFARTSNSIFNSSFTFTVPPAMLTGVIPKSRCFKVHVPAYRPPSFRTLARTSRVTP